ncbi:glutathione S-transferase family protein [Sphingomonas profundi]|uniref:glutathione S-transferase family protein n=1 Tax=Alterirhizorhabdus profundi TaxID=2681549 RepID=UPI0012E75664|nr:glutathione S-transferase N-terminal domain-containing protein [Sphingomonas profundi]
MIDFYYNTGPNPMKVALLLEELGVAYRPVPVDMLRGEQFDAGFARINPNNKLPAIVDEDGTAVFDSNAILLHLADKHRRFVPVGVAERGTMLSWLMFVASGVGPYSGQAVHFQHFAPEPKDYAVTRYLFEARRHFEILDRRLADSQWMLGDDYSIVDMAVWGWGRVMARPLGDDAPARFPNVARLVATIDARPAAARVATLRDTHAFSQQFDQAAQQTLFRHLAPRAD